MECNLEYIKRQPGAIINLVNIAGSKVLDVGTGKGMMAISLAKKNYNVVSIDNNQKLQIEAKENSKEAGVAAKINFVLGELTSLPFEDNSFDCVFSFQTLHHLTDKNTALSEMFRVVKKEGKVVIVEMNKSGMEAVFRILQIPEHKHPVKDIRKLLEKFTIKISIINGEIMDAYVAIK